MSLVLWLGLACETGDTGLDSGAPGRDSGDTSGETASPATRRVGEVPLGEGIALRGAATGDRFGEAVTAGDLDGDGVAEVIVGAADAGGGAGVVYVFAGPVAGETTAAAADRTLVGSGAFGASVAVIADLDGDGRPELAVGAPHADGAAPGAGTASLFAAGATTAADAWFRANGAAAADGFGARVAPAGDTDGDGVDELLVGAWLADDPGADAGGVAVFAPVAGTIGADAARFSLTGESAGDWAGFGACGGGDLDGDGLGDLLIGADGVDETGQNAGAAYVVSGGKAGAAGLGTAEARLLGEGAGDNAGHAVAWVPDTDGDGADELLVGALANSAGGKRAGAAYLLTAPASGSLGAAAVVLRGTAGDHFGYSVAGLGDTDGDGLGDVLVGARFDSAGGADAGGAWLLFGPVDADKDVTARALHVTGAAGEEAGFTVGAGGDVTGDGLRDAFVGAPAADGGAGRVYVVPGATP